MSFDVEIWLRGDNHATTARVTPAIGEPRTWKEGEVTAVLTAMLRALDRAKHPDAGEDRQVTLRGFSWIVNPYEGGVLIAIEMTLGAVVAGPFDIAERDLTALITRVMAGARGEADAAPTVH